MKFAPIILATLSGMMPAAVSALGLDFPSGAVQITNKSQAVGSTAIPVGPYANGHVQTVAVEGAVSAEAWQVIRGDLTTLQLMLPLREQLVSDGFEIMFDCETSQCGGFDFRYDIDLLPEPEMHVDLGDFRFLTARKLDPDETPEFVSLMVSRSAETGFVQMTHVGAIEEPETLVIASSKSTEPEITPTPLPIGTLAEMLELNGRAPLEDLVFQTGSSQLGEGSFGSLAELSTFLKANPDSRVALVGHTDTQGALSSNLALSKKRAASVLQRLVSVYDIPRRQLEADGVGYLAPRASNLTEEGRTQNRRVEVILTSGSLE